MKNRIKRTFKELRQNHGFVARMNFTCCSSCGWYEMSQNKALKGLSEAEIENANIVFYHNQDKSSMEEYGKLYLAWSGNGQTIVNALVKNRLLVEWDGKRETRIMVTPMKARQDD